MASRSWRQNVTIADPPVAKALLTNTRWAWLWLIVRVYIGYAWLTAGLAKLSNPAWVKTGAALKAFWQKAVVVPAPPARPIITYDWYRAFIQMLLNDGSYVWFAKLVVVGEILVGIALILGLFTGIAALLGGFMNWNYMLAGTASTNPVLFFLAILLVLAWKTAGWWGLDRWLLPMVGAPWQPGKMFKGQADKSEQQST